MPPDLSFVDLDLDGRLLDPGSGAPVCPDGVRMALEQIFAVGADATDIIVFVHGWRTSGVRAEDLARRFAELVDRRYADAAEAHTEAGTKTDPGTDAESPPCYPRLAGFRPQYIAIRWPSQSSPLPKGYRKIRERARAMTEHGDAAKVLAALLGYLNENRRIPSVGPDALRTSTGQYLHCVGHSFGGRFLGHAITRAAAEPATLGWPWRDGRYPYVVDSLLVFQMAMAPDAFGTELSAVLTDSPINGPVVLTYSRHDRALGLWHKLAESGVRGIGYGGATAPREVIKTVTLRPVSSEYSREELTARIVNVDANARFKAQRHSPPGSHSDYFHPESAHLLLSLADFSR